ncbi:hypothetical protein T459_30610 [Capsicum annuum]|uniref:Reverse transcriptase domain-containing protein n=1 Tax=Capsicum annuum TaxID=4072 RepID=A0A2G2Y8T8_CAPAN|nr:hypothetical protein T459_30610 [Capsicum annuum]
MIEESIIKQKARVHWLKVGYSNTKWFFASMKVRQSQNYISKSMDISGHILHTKIEVEAKVRQFNENLLGSAAHSLPAIDPQVMPTRPQLDRRQYFTLVAPVTNAEVWQEMQDIDDSKAPGCDGLNAVFFKKSWSIIGAQVTEAVQFFFETSTLYKAVNCIPQ